MVHFPLNSAYALNDSYVKYTYRAGLLHETNGKVHHSINPPIQVG